MLLDGKYSLMSSNDCSIVLNDYTAHFGAFRKVFSRIGYIPNSIAKESKILPEWPCQCCIEGLAVAGD